MWLPDSTLDNVALLKLSLLLKVDSVQVGTVGKEDKNEHSWVATTDVCSKTLLILNQFTWVNCCFSVKDKIRREENFHWKVKIHTLDLPPTPPPPHPTHTYTNTFPYPILLDVLSFIVTVEILQIGTQNKITYTIFVLKIKLSLYTTQNLLRIAAI